MEARHSHPLQRAAGWVLLAAGGPLLWASAQPGAAALEAGVWLTWQTGIELMAVLLALLVFAIGQRAILSAREGAVVLLATAFLGVAALGFLHAARAVGGPGPAAPGLPLGHPLAGLGARLLAAAALLAYVLLPASVVVTAGRRRLALATMAVLVAAVAGLAASLPASEPAPGWSWLVVALHGATLFVLWRRRAALRRECLMALGFAAALAALSAVFFTPPARGAPPLADAAGHLYTVAAYFYLGHAIFHEALRRPLERLQEQHRRESVVLDAAPDGVLWVAEDGRIRMANPAMQALSGYPPQQLVGREVALLIPEASAPRHAAALKDYFGAPRARAMGGMDLALRRSDGSLLPVDISLGYHAADGHRFAIAYIRDLSERKRMELALRHQATHDALTGLPNRWLFQLQLKQALVRAERLQRLVAVLFLDLDHFKAVNDGWGHAAGDELLRQVAGRLRALLRENDLLARLGGDEFAVLLADLETPADAAQVVAKLLAAMKPAFRVQQRDLHSGASIGLAFYPDDAQESETLLRFADMAMYQAKQSGRGGYACFAPQLDWRVKQDLALHGRLQQALASGLLALHYQPQVALADGAVLGVEALLRFTDPELGPEGPERCIAVAESTGLIHALSDWVLTEACRQIAVWSAQGRPLKVAINVSAQQFHERLLQHAVAQALAASGAEARWLGLELTESTAMAHAALACEQLQALAALGCGIALDDFGTGHSSLARLKDLPVDTLKIDRGFVDGLPHDAGSAAVVQATVTLAHGLGKRVVAEGVETQAQFDFLRACGCEAGQGFLIAPAMPAQTLQAFIDARAWPPAAHADGSPREPAPHGGTAP